MTERARCIVLVPHESSIRLWHYGRYGYAWEDVGAPRQRVPSAKNRVAP